MLPNSASMYVTRTTGSNRKTSNIDKKKMLNQYPYDTRACCVEMFFHRARSRSPEMAFGSDITTLRNVVSPFAFIMISDLKCHESPLFIFLFLIYKRI